ncbi:TRAP transporter large permease subunit [Iocasia frigidifontis]|uniref:TRAP transporter large permease subunit n=1 Tax=Iocasia fonsfrigidae TaxID=2682810 RepID=A0A8A7KHT3_9FIRM|nr:TRAP transporter large permease [Iocasia fonsfrigidae]QTL99338.1 TRAP transporter large permease subunit [Iocasia fonsfrigidae]
MTLPLFVSFVILIFLNVPIAFSLAISSCVALYFGGFPLNVVIQRMVTAADSFLLLAIPFFILAGNIMKDGEISKKLINFADSLVGFITGGLAQVNIVTSMFFAGITGAAVADTSAVGSVLIPPMVEREYDADFSGAVTAASSVIGVIIPPSIPMVVYGVVTGVSVGKMFMGGLIPGILVGVIMMIASYVISKKRGYPSGKSLSIKNILVNFKESILALIMPLIIVGGIFSGVFTPTEAAVIAVIYSLIISLFVYRTIKIKDLPRIILESAYTTAVVMLMLVAAFLFSWIITRERIPVQIANFLTTLALNRTVVLVLVSIFYIVAGTLMDLTANIILLVPVLFPAIQNLGVDPIHFGLITVVALAIGLVTPPVGACLFVASEISNTSIVQQSKALIPYIISLVLVLILLILIPEISVFIPNLFS